MSMTDALALRGSGLDEFLYASVDVEPSGLNLNLLSVFARRGDDPWKEAGKLVSLSKADAVASLAQTIVRMPQSVRTLSDATAIAARLVTLLPSRLGNVVPQQPLQLSVIVRKYRVVGIGLALAAALAGASMMGLFSPRQAAQFDGSEMSTPAPATPAPPKT